MRHFQNIVIGFGKAGKTLAGTLVKHGQEVLVIEKDAGMYGGTCINVACLPTKNLLLNAHRGVDYQTALQTKNDLTAKLRTKNYHKVADLELATVLDATASFVDDQTLLVKDDSGSETLTFDRLFINTGARPMIPEIDGLTEGPRVFTSQTLLAKEDQLASLAILGAGPIGLEFSSLYAQFKSQVTVINRHEEILPHVDENIASLAMADLESDGVTFLNQSTLTKVEEVRDGLKLTVATPAGEQKLEVAGLLVAAGRRPNTADLRLENTSLTTGAKGEVVVNDKLETNVPGIYALGDVAGSPQFTFISLDDWRIMANQLFGDQSRTRANRPTYATTVFLNPALSSVGLTKKQLDTAGRPYQLLSMPAAAVPKAQVIGNPRGILQALVDPASHEILGATIYAEEAYETINVLTLAIQHHLTAEDLRDQIYTHPTMTEALNDLFSQL